MISVNIMIIKKKQKMSTYQVKSAKMALLKNIRAIRSQRFAFARTALYKMDPKDIINTLFHASNSLKKSHTWQLESAVPDGLRSSQAEGLSIS